MKTHIPIHSDLDLTTGWLEAHGLKLGTDFFYNSVRDGSGRHDGYVICAAGGESTSVSTRREAEIAIKWLESQRALYVVRTAGNNGSEWAEWAQKWAAHAQRPTTFSAPSADAPKQEFEQCGFMELRPFPSGARFVHPHSHSCEGDSVPVYRVRTPE